jgi:hypothetical protein
MKTNLFQKILLSLYGICLVYFSILHVPFKTGYNEIEYDTLFSTKSNLLISRLVLIIVVVSILTGLLFLLAQNLKLKFSVTSPIRRINKRIVLYSLVAIVLLAILFYAINLRREQIQIKQPISTIALDSSASRADSTSVTPAASSSEDADLKRKENCTEENALIQFRSYMKFYYPDWKIYGKPKVKESSEEFGSPCSYQIQFTTSDPHMTYYTQKEVMIVEISFTFDYSRYRFKTIRGTLY